MALKSKMLHVSNRRLHVWLLAIIVVMGANCGSSPAAPNYPILQNPGFYWLDVTGYAISTNPEVPPCLPPVTVFTHVRLRLDVRMEGGLWVGRSTSAGDLELRILGDNETVGGFEVTGSASGTALDTETKPISDVSVRLAGTAGSAAAVKGLAERTGRYVSGTIAGDIQYFNSVGSARCTAAIWSLQPAPS